MPAGKLIAHHRHGQGKIAARELTALRAGPIHASKNAADMFVDIAPHLSLAGLNIDRTMDRRGNTMRDGDESHIQSRTRGRDGRKQNDGRSHHAPDIVARGEFKNGKSDGR